MNSLTMKINSLWELEQPKSIKAYVFSIIDSKIAFIEQRTRQFFADFQLRFSAKASNSFEAKFIQAAPKTDMIIAEQESENAFQCLEELSRSMYVLERMKFSLNEENALDIMQLLNDDNYLTVNDIQMDQLLEVRSAA